MQQELKRRLGLFSVVTISISSMVGSGIFVLPGIGFATTGPSLYLAFLLSAICILPAAMSKAELATAMPTSGGTYVYIERTFGPLAGTVAGLGLFLSILLKASFSLVGFGAYLSVLAEVPLQPAILAILVLLVTINMLGVSKVSGLLTVVLFVSITSLGIICSYAMTGLWEVERMTPVMAQGWEGFAAATALVFVSYAGVTKVAAIAEEVKSPHKNLHRGILLSLFIVTLIYCSVSFVLAGVFPMADIAHELRPIYLLAEKVGGHTLGIFMAAVAVLTMANTANAGILAGSRFPFAMSRDKLLPDILGKLHRNYLTPVPSIFLSGIIIATVIISFDVAKIAKLASAFMIMIYIIENVAVLVLRESRPQWYTPAYKAPLYPFMQAFGTLSGLILLASMGKLAILGFGGIAIPGVLFFLVYSRKKTTRKGVVGIRGRRTDLIQEDATNPKISFLDLDKDAQVVVSLFGKERSPEMLIEMGVAMAEHGNIEVAHITEVPEQTTLQDFIDEPADLRSLRRRVLAMANEKNESITFDNVTSHDMSRTIYEISQRLHCEWLLIEWRGKKQGSLTIHNPIGWLKSHLHCNLAIFRDTGVRYIRKIMVLINDDHNDGLVLETADHLAAVNKADVTLMKFVSTKTAVERKQYEQSYLSELGNKIKSPSSGRIISGNDEIKALIAETAEYDLLIMGSADHNLVTSFTGAYHDKLIAKAACSVLAVHRSAISE